MAIGKEMMRNFNVILQAAGNRDLALVECRCKHTGKPVNVICVVTRTGTVYEIMPVAKMFDGDPFEELDPPS